MILPFAAVTVPGPGKRTTITICERKRDHVIDYAARFSMLADVAIKTVDVGRLMTTMSVRHTDTDVALRALHALGVRVHGLRLVVVEGTKCCSSCQRADPENAIYCTCPCLGRFHGQNLAVLPPIGFFEVGIGSPIEHGFTLDADGRVVVTKVF